MEPQRSTPGVSDTCCVSWETCSSLAQLNVALHHLIQAMPCSPRTVPSIESGSVQNSMSRLLFRLRALATGVGIAMGGDTTTSGVGGEGEAIAS